MRCRWRLILVLQHFEPEFTGALSGKSPEEVNQMIAERDGKITQLDLVRCAFHLYRYPFIYVLVGAPAHD
jgi:hypothetical protein